MSYLILGLPRSRTAWLSKFLTYGDWSCGHEQARHWRSLDDAKAWFGQDCTGTAETSLAPFWRLLDGNVKVVLVRRPVADVVESLMRLEGVTFDRAALTQTMTALDRKMDQIAARLDCLTVDYADLAKEETCKAVFEYCLPYGHDHEHWARWDAVNVQCDMRAMMRYCLANAPALEKLAKIARHQMRTALVTKAPYIPDGLTLQIESFDDWIKDAVDLFDDHLTVVGEAPGDWQKKNLPLFKRFDDAGFLQILTARSNGRMFGYLVTLVTPSLVSADITSAAHNTFYASPDAPGLGMKLQRAALVELKKRGVHDVFMQARTRGSGERIASIYKRLGAESDGQVFRLELAGV